jgi:hypothetical protein
MRVVTGGSLQVLLAWCGCTQPGKGIVIHQLIADRREKAINITVFLLGTYLLASNPSTQTIMSTKRSNAKANGIPDAVMEKANSTETRT